MNHAQQLAQIVQRTREPVTYNDGRFFVEYRPRPGLKVTSDMEDDLIALSQRAAYPLATNEFGEILQRHRSRLYRARRYLRRIVFGPLVKEAQAEFGEIERA